MRHRDARRHEKMKGRRHYYSDYASNGLSCPDAVGVTLVAYDTCKKVLLSDHLPVYATLNMRVKRVDWAAREGLLLDLHRVITTEWAPQEAYLCYGTSFDGSPGDLVSLSPTFFDLSCNNRETVPLKLHLTANSLGMNGDMAIACGILAFTLPPWISVKGASATANATATGVTAAQFAASKVPGEEEWVNLCILQEGSQKAEVHLLIDCVAAMSEFGIENYRTEARLRHGAQQLHFKVDAAASEEEVFERAGRLLNSHGEEVPETFGTLCVRCRVVPSEEQHATGIRSEPLDHYLPIKLFLGSDAVVDDN